MGKSVLEFGKYEGSTLRAENVNSIFMPDWFDDAIIGIDSQTKSIIYSLDKLVELEIAYRFEDGGLNPEYDEVDDDILIIGLDSITKLFKMLQLEKDGVLPTLYNELTESVVDPTAPNICSGIEFVLGNEVRRAKTDLNLSSKVFTYEQLDEIVNSNDDDFLRWIEMQQFNHDSTFELVPRELMDFCDDEPYIRAVVKLVDEPYWLGFQDLTLDQWEEGKIFPSQHVA